MSFDIKSSILKEFLSQYGEVPFSVEQAGEPPFIIGQGEPAFKVKVSKPISKADLMRSTSLALGEAYMDRGIEIEGDLFTALNIVLRQLPNFSADTKALKNILFSSTKANHQKQEVTYHYDIGNDFYKLWLGSTLNYSCAYFKKEDDTLDQAQENKTDRILQKLQLSPGMTLLDIGCGWGYLLLKAAKEYGVKGTGITLSEEQAKEFRNRIEAAGIQDQLDVRIMDYRDLKKSGMQFDRVVSVGMIEHVGRDNYELFVKNVDAVLKSKGLFLLHYISALKEHPGDPWIKKYIFPGGTIPSLREIINQCSENNFYTLDVESMRRHYVLTLLRWYENFQAQLNKIKTMFDDRFIRMWELYLVSCAASFNNGIIDLHQILMSKGSNNDLPMIRPYL